MSSSRTGSQNPKCQKLQEKSSKSRLLFNSVIILCGALEDGHNTLVLTTARHFNITQSLSAKLLYS
eukprot:1658554-Amphidinium_carterae.1